MDEVAIGTPNETRPANVHLPYGSPKPAVHCHSQPLRGGYLREQAANLDLGKRVPLDERDTLPFGVLERRVARKTLVRCEFPAGALVGCRDYE